MEVKSLVLEKKHIDLGGKMMPFAGFNMPVRYSSDKEEHLAVRENAGIFDVSHMGEFLVRGERALDLIQYVSSNDASVLYPGKVQYSCLPNKTGGIVDDLLVYKINENEYMLVVNASNIEKDWNWIKQNNSFQAELRNVSDQTSLFALQGPNAIKVLQKITNTKLAEMEYYTFTKGNIDEVCDDAIISATGYTGSGGFELYVKNNVAADVWDKIFEAGAEFNLKPIGLGARDTLRLEMGYCLYGNDIYDATSPLEAGLGWVTKFSKNFVNSSQLKKQKEEGVKKKLVGFKMEDRGIPRAGYHICDVSGNKVGQVTSGTMSPSLNVGIGMGYVPISHSKSGTDIHISIREKLLRANVVKMPFYRG